MQYPKLVESKISANEVVSIEWNPGMDLLATVFSNGALTCSRLLSLQKVWHKQSIGKIISIAWRPDGRVLAAGSYNDKTKEHICTLHDVENGKEINSITRDQPITSIAWFQYIPMNDDATGDDLNRTKVENLLKSIAGDNFSHQLAHEQYELNILMISTNDGTISFYALGLFFLGDISIHVDSNSRIDRIHMSNGLRYLTSVIHTKHGNTTLSTLKVRKLDIFQRRSNEILRVAKMYAKITDELEYLENTIGAITTSWADVLAGLDNKLSSYCSRRNKKVDSNRGGYTFLSADELLQLSTIGVQSSNVEKFLTDMSDKGLKKLSDAIEQTCRQIQNLIVKNALKCCYHLYEDLNYLRGMSLWRDRFEDVGLEDKFFVDAMRSVASLQFKLTELQQVIDHSFKSSKSFFRWLTSIACRMNGEPSNSVVPNTINKTTDQDKQLITDFICENFDYNSNRDELDMSASLAEGDSQTDDVRPTCSNFTLEQVGQYLKNESLSRLKHSFAKPGTNFWIEFLKNNPDLVETKKDVDGSTVLLFNRHNEDTSLIQEHREACRSIKDSFKSVATNFKTVLGESDTVINIKDFVKNAPANRIRIETDMNEMQHHTLFQTKSGPVQRQYLISQAIEERSLKLYSIEFKSAKYRRGSTSESNNSSDNHNLLITDSCFFENKEARELLLSFLLIDKTLGDTIMVQVELKKIASDNQCQERAPKDVAKIFRSNDSIDKHSTQVILKLDIYTEPASDRRIDQGMMVKKIKSTIGRDMFSSSSRGVIAFTSCDNKRLHLYELESSVGEPEMIDDEVEGDEKIDESLIDTELVN